MTTFPIHLTTDGQFQTFVNQIAWLLGNQVEVEVEHHDDGIHIVLKDVDYDMDGELHSTKEEDE
jgi:hypothetical protein